MASPRRSGGALAPTGAEVRIRAHLKTLGLGEYETRVYVALLAQGALTGADLVNVAQVPQKRVYQVLTRLSDLRLVDKEEQRGGRFRALGTGALQALVDARKSQALTAIDDLDREWHEVLPLVAALRRDGDEPADGGAVSVLVGVEQYRLAYNELLRTTASELLSFTKPPFVLPPDPRINGIDLLDRGVRVRCIYELGPGGAVDEAHRRVVETGVTQWLDAGEEVRIAPALPAKMLVHDRSTVLLVLTDPATRLVSPTAAVIRNAGFAEAQARLFDLYWSRATAVTARTRRRVLDTVRERGQPGRATAR